MSGDKYIKKKSERVELGLQTRKPTDVDKAIIASRERKLTAEELSGFVKAETKQADKKPTCRPFVEMHAPSKEDGPRGYSIIFGIKGTF